MNSSAQPVAEVVRHHRVDFGGLDAGVGQRAERRLEVQLQRRLVGAARVGGVGDADDRARVAQGCSWSRQHRLAGLLLDAERAAEERDHVVQPDEHRDLDELRDVEVLADHRPRLVADAVVHVQLVGGVEQRGISI